jgi:Histidine kinase-, DNA gyrase B-, and HSP90-like ATPase
VTLRNRVSVAAAVGVLIVVAAVGSVLYFAYAASVHSRVDATLVDAAQQASGVAQRIKQSVSASGSKPDFDQPVTVGSVELQLFLGPVGVGQPTEFGPLSKRDVAVAEGAQPAYFANVDDGGHQFRVYTAAMAGTSNAGLVRTSRAADADDGTLRNAALLLATLTVGAAGVTYGTARLTAGRILLVHNAIKWSPPGTAVSVVVENGRVSVSDHGPGIAPEDLPHIFERFYRAPDARGMPGAGLGLAIVGSVAQANNGTVEVRTGPAGSTFTLAFAPLADVGEFAADQEEAADQQE